MDVPIEIVFHNMSSSPTIEAEIRERVDKLDRLYGHLIGCRVSVELLHRRHKTGNLYDIHIDLHVPGNELAPPLRLATAGAGRLDACLWAFRGAAHRRRGR